MSIKKFPDNFAWGVATASYQIEGANRTDGRGECIWDRYCSVPGNILNGDDAKVACDHYHLYKKDVAIMKEMGMKAYRFSISWPRILPKGTGEVNAKGVQFYSDLVDELLSAGIEPYVTLYHWDLPQAMQDIGGWANEEMPQHFLAYSNVVFDALGDRVKHWITLNEPYCAAFLGNAEGRHAPGIRDFSTALRVAYHEYVGHGLVVKSFRECGRKGEIGIALNLMGRLPYSSSDEDIQAAKIADGYINRWFLDPLIKGSFPQDMIAHYEAQGVVMPPFKAEHLQLMQQKLDFIALNYYNDFYVKKDATKWPLGFRIENPKNCPLTDRDWPITETGFCDMLLRMKNEYGIENIYISENGASYLDNVDLHHEVKDTLREDFLHRHLLSMHQAIAMGVNVKGYFVWSLCDNFEWSFGYSSRFGIVYVDFNTQERIIKQSGHWYAKTIAANAVED